MPQGEFADKSRGLRLQRVMADAGVAARRECEELVLSGAVTVNGKVIDRLPAWVDPSVDKIEVYGRPLRRAEKHVYIVLFKPRGTVCTNSDPEGRPRAIDLVEHPSKPRLYCVGRLDLDSSGLLILTNDGEFANRVTHPRYLVEKGYDITVDGRLDEKAIADLERKIFAAERGARRGETRSSLRLVSRDRDKTVLHLTLCEHRNLQIRPLMLELGHPVNKLRRTSFGPLRLKGLAVGEWRELASREVEQLLRASKSEDPSARRAPREPKRSMVELAVAREERAERLAAESASASAAKPDARTPGAKTPGAKTPSARTTEARTPSARTSEPKRREQAKPARRPDRKDGPRRTERTAEPRRTDRKDGPRRPERAAEPRRTERKDGPRRPDGKDRRSGEQTRGGRPPRSGKPAPRARRPR
jgi:pseudouridine synthase